MIQKLAPLILVLFLTGCNNSGLTSSIHEPAYMPEEITMIPGDDISENPTESANPTPSVSATPVAPTTDQTSPQSATVRPKPAVSGTTRVKPAVSGSAQVKPPQPKVAPVTPAHPRTSPRIAFPKSTLSMSKIIQNAYSVMNNAKDIAWINKACNRYVSLVLARSGFSRDGFLANDFDVYAKKNLKQARDVLFKGDVGLAAEQARLKQHIWSYPERTPFILQWTRPGPHGHIAIIERIGDNLFIFQAELNNKHPYMKAVNVNTLLNAQRSKHLNVYSEL